MVIRLVYVAKLFVKGDAPAKIQRHVIAIHLASVKLPAESASLESDAAVQVVNSRPQKAETAKCRSPLR